MLVKWIELHTRFIRMNLKRWAFYYNHLVMAFIMAPQYLGRFVRRRFNSHVGPLSVWVLWTCHQHSRQSSFRPESQAVIILQKISPALSTTNCQFILCNRIMTKATANLIISVQDFGFILVNACWNDVRKIPTPASLWRFPSATVCLPSHLQPIRVRILLQASLISLIHAAILHEFPPCSSFLHSSVTARWKNTS